MRLHNYLEDVLGSKVKVKVLRELFKYHPKPYTIRELAASINGVTHTGVRKVLGDLLSSNLIRVEHHGQSNLITLNDKSEIYGELRNLFALESKTLYNLTHELKKLHNDIVSCAMFGSVARSEERPDSDIDVLFITDDREAVQKFVADKSRFFTNRYGNVVMPYIMSRSEFVRKRNTHF